MLVALEGAPTSVVWEKQSAGDGAAAAVWDVVRCIGMIR
jgi:hypothetical protein